MFGVLGHIRDFYEEFIRKEDSRVTKWPLMDGPAPTLTLVTLYILFVKVIGPKLMMDRKPFDLRRLMLLYNIVLVLLNIYMVIETLIVIFPSVNKGICRKESLSDPDRIRIVELGWLFFCVKFVEFLDTIFFVLRKKFRQISRLHVIHHSVVPVAIWAVYRVEPASYNYFFPVVNAVVHVVMYSYYALSALGPNVQKYLWWKKYLTTLQMIQFVMIFPYTTLLFLYGCEVSKFVLTVNFVLAGLFLVMFYDYYLNTYVKKEVNRRSHGNHDSDRKYGLNVPIEDCALSLNNRFREQRIQDEKKID